MAVRSFKVFVRYELDGKEEEFCFFKDLNMLHTDHMVAAPLISECQAILTRNLGWDADKITSFKAWWVERPVGGGYDYT